MALANENISINSIAGVSGRKYFFYTNSDIEISLTTTWSGSATHIKYELFYGTTLGERNPYNSLTYPSSATTLSTTNIYQKDISGITTDTISFKVGNTRDLTKYIDSSNRPIAIFKITINNNSEAISKEILIPIVQGATLPYAFFLDCFIYRATIENNQIIKGENYNNLCFEIYFTINPDFLSNTISSYHIDHTQETLYGFGEDWSDLELHFYYDNLEFLSDGIVKMTTMLTKNSNYQLVSLNSSNQITDDTSIEGLRITGLVLTDGTQSFRMFSTSVNIINLLNNKQLSMYVNPNGISFGGKQLDNNYNLTVYGSIIASNLENLFNNITYSKQILNTIEYTTLYPQYSQNSDVFGVIGEKSFATTTANTLQYTGLEVDLEAKHIYALYGSTTAGYITKIALYTINSAGTSWYNHFTYDFNSGTTTGRMVYCLPIFYCRSDVTVRLYVARTTTSTTKNTYRIYNVAGPLF